MNFAYYTSFFHDRSLNAIRHVGNCAEFELESAQLVGDENREHIQLDEANRFRGVLSLRRIRAISINDEKSNQQLVFPCDYGEIFSLSIAGNMVKLCIEWTNYRPRPDVAYWWTLEIDADEIVWEDALNSSNSR